jgi:hypothetical protein
MTTFTARLDDRRKTFALWFTVQGIATVFKERSSIDASTILGETRPEVAIIMKGGIEEGGRQIDMVTRRVTGGSLKVTLLEPTSSSVLRDLFQARKRKRTVVAVGGITAAAVTMNVADNSWAPASGTVYVGAETITYTGKGANTLTGLTRAKYGSLAQAQAGQTNQGAAVFDVPPAWLGRRITLYGSFLREDGTTTAALTQKLGTYSIEKPPTHEGDRKWTIEAGPIADEFAQMKLFVGMKSVGGGKLYLRNPTDETYRVSVDDINYFAAPSSGLFNYVLVKLAGDPACYFAGLITDVDEANLEIVVQKVDMFSPSFRRSQIAAATSAQGGFDVDSVSTFAILGGVPGTLVLYALCSILGDGTNGTYDKLAGNSRTGADFGLPSWRLGAAINQADVDVAAFGNPIAGHPWRYVLDAQTTVAELLKEYCYLANAFWFDDVAGRLTVRTLSDVPTASSKTIDASLLAADTPPKAMVDEGGIYPVVVVTLNYSLISKQFLVTDYCVDDELLLRYPTRTDSLKVQMKGIAIDLGNAASEFPQRYLAPASFGSEGDLKQMTRQWQLADGRGRLTVNVTCVLRALGLWLGDVVTIGFDIPDQEGGSLLGRRARIIGRTPRYDTDRVDLVLHVMETVVLLAPSAVITNVTTTTLANDTLTLSTTAPDVSGANPENDFPVGAQLRIWDVSAGTSQVVTVAAILSAHRLKLTAGIAAGTELGRDWLTWNTLATNAGLTSPSGYGENDLAYDMPSTGNPAAGAIRRWR